MLWSTQGLTIMVHLTVINVDASQDGHLLLKAHHTVSIEGPQVLGALHTHWLTAAPSYGCKVARTLYVHSHHDLTRFTQDNQKHVYRHLYGMQSLWSDVPLIR